MPGVEGEGGDLRLNALMAVLTKLPSIICYQHLLLQVPYALPQTALCISRAVAQGKQVLRAWNFYLALPVVLAITPTSGFLSQDHTNNPNNPQIPPVPAILADWQIHPSFPFPPHMQNKNSESEDRRIQSVLNGKGKNPFTSMCWYWCHQDVWHGLNQREMDTNWNEQPFWCKQHFHGQDNLQLPAKKR